MLRLRGMPRLPTMMMVLGPATAEEIDDDGRRQLVLPGSADAEPEAVENGEYYDIEDGFEAARALRVAPPCVKPTAAEVRRHRINGHNPYRSWCSCCVSGVANDRSHVQRAEVHHGSVFDCHSDCEFSVSVN